MNPVRQLGSGLLYALISVVLVIGGLSLAMAEGGLKALPTGMPSLTATVPSAEVTALVSATPFPSAAPSATVQILVPTATAIVIAPSATPYIQPTATFWPIPSSTRVPYRTAIPCGPYYGWVKNYIVQEGDTLFRIAALYHTTYTALQIANCKFTSTTIYAGERLWVPNIPIFFTPAVTLIPTFATSTPLPYATSTPSPYATSTPVPTEPLTLTPIPTFFTETAIPTETTSVPSP